MAHFAFNPDFDAYFRDDPHGISSLERFRLGLLVGWKWKSARKIVLFRVDPSSYRNISIPHRLRFQLERFTASSNASRLNHTILGSLLEETRAKREIVFQSVFDRE